MLSTVWLEPSKTGDPLCPTHRHDLKATLLDGLFVWQVCDISSSLPLLFLAVLCAERVGQMTKTYNDIDAVTRLLEEVSVSGEAKSHL